MIFKFRTALYGAVFPNKRNQFSKKTNKPQAASGRETKNIILFKIHLWNY